MFTCVVIVGWKVMLGPKNSYFLVVVKCIFCWFDNLELWPLAFNFLQCSIAESHQLGHFSV